MTPPKRTSGKYRTPRPLLDARKAIQTLKDANRFQSALLDRLEKTLVEMEQLARPGTAD